MGGGIDGTVSRGASCRLRKMKAATIAIQIALRRKHARQPNAPARERAQCQQAVGGASTAIPNRTRSTGSSLRKRAASRRQKKHSQSKSRADAAQEFVSLDSREAGRKKIRRRKRIRGRAREHDVVVQVERRAHCRALLLALLRREQ